MNILPLSTAVAILSASLAAPAQAIPSDAHKKCLNATDYAGCVSTNRRSSAEEELITGIMWDTAKWENDFQTVRVKLYRMRGGGFWLGNSMRLSVMEVDCDSAQFDVESDGYKKQSLEGDAWRQAPLIYSRLCTIPMEERAALGQQDAG